MNPFLDTYALIAWLNERDPDHERVTAYFDAFNGVLLCTEWVLMELADAFYAPPARGVATRFLRKVRNDSLFEIVPYDLEVFDAGFDLFANRPDKEWSLTDCISFAVMTERGLTDALTADRHFEQAGFRAVFKR
jgi:predicted nucleic acid-binding protein